MTQLKPWTSFDDQLALLRARGMQVGDDAAALSYLARIGYYRLSGYWYPLRVIDGDASKQAGRPLRRDEFVSGSRFEDVVKLYVFDKKLRLLALDALERIEMAIRADVAHQLGARDPCAHENLDLLHGNFARRAIRRGPNAGKTEHQIWLEKFQQLLHRARREPFIVHHRQAYEGKLPIWVAMEVWDFGTLSKLFAGMQVRDQDQVAGKYGDVGGRAFGQWLRSLNFMRNVAAHHSRLWNINVLEVAPLPSGWPDMPNNKPFLYLSIMQLLLRTICPNSSWGQRLVDLLNSEFPALPGGAAVLSDMGAFDGWQSWDLWRQK